MPLNARIMGAASAFFSFKNFTDVIVHLPKPQTPMTDLLFPKEKRRQKTSPYIAIADVQNETGAVPVIVRGTQSYAVDTGKVSGSLIEVQPLTMNKMISGAELNTLISMGVVDNINAALTETVENLRDRTAVSTEILVCQALSGTITYPAATAGGGTTNYKIQLGSPQNPTAATLTASSSMADVQKELEKQFLAQQQTGAAGDVRFFAGSDIYGVFIDIISKAQGAVPVQWTDYGMVLFGKYKIMPISSTYSLPGQTAVTAVIDAKSLQTVDLTNTGKLFYAALDELDAQLRPLPFFASYEEIKDPSGLKVLSSSKPLPAFAVSKSTIKKYMA